MVLCDKPRIRGVANAYVPDLKGHVGVDHCARHGKHKWYNAMVVDSRVILIVKALFEEFAKAF